MRINKIIIKIIQTSCDELNLILMSQYIGFLLLKRRMVEFWRKIQPWQPTPFFGDFFENFKVLKF